MPGAEQIVFLLSVKRAEFVPVMCALTFGNDECGAGFVQRRFLAGQFRIKRLERGLLRLNF